MIRRPMVFVLGAGASVDFQFPVGKALLETVTNWRTGAAGRDHMIRDLGYSEQDLLRFFEALRYSGEASIDAFLEKRPEFMDIGKAAMAIALIGREQTPRLFEEQNGLNWMKYLLGRMQGRTFEEFANNAVSFVTFNYDRVIEHFLFTALKNSWGKSDENVAAILEKIPVVHLHGRLGYLPWQTWLSKGNDVRAFEPSINNETIRVAAQGIKVVHEGIEDRKEQFDQAKELIKNAERVYFLGVGTNNVNLERIGVHEIASSPSKAFATEVGLTPTEFQDAQRRYGTTLHFQRGYDCRALISNFVRWD